MNNGPDVTAQEFAYRAIRAAVPAGVPVETRPRTNGQIPYVFVGNATLKWHPVGHEITLGVEVWSKKEGPIEAKQVQHAIRLALDGLVHSDAPESASADVWRFTLIQETASRMQLEATNNVWHGTQQFRVLAETAG